MKLTEEIKKILNEEKYHQLGTASAKGIPNVCCIACYYLKDDETIVIVDNFFNKTKNNLMENPRASILVRTEKVSYQIKGKAAYLTQGPDYEEARKWMKAKADIYPAKGALVINVQEIYNSSPGPDAGKKI